MCSPFFSYVIILLYKVAIPQCVCLLILSLPPSPPCKYKEERESKQSCDATKFLVWLYKRSYIQRLCPLPCEIPCRFSDIKLLLFLVFSNHKSQTCQERTEAKSRRKGVVLFMVKSRLFFYKLSVKNKALLYYLTFLHLANWTFWILNFLQKFLIEIGHIFLYFLKFTISICQDTSLSKVCNTVWV